MDETDAGTTRPVLDPTERRILGTLIEKSLATPDLYPLTINALVAGCNQKSNRNPTMALEAFEIQGALTALQLKGMVKTLDRLGGRTIRYRHRLDEVLGLAGPGLAILAELMLRGPQTVNELKTRIARMGSSLPAEEVESLLRGRSSGADPLFMLLPRGHGERYPRWMHQLSPAGEDALPAEGSFLTQAVSPAPASAASAAVSPSPTPSPAPSPTPLPALAGGSGHDLLGRLEALEARVARLEAAGKPVEEEKPEAPPPSEASEWIDLD